MTRAIHTLAQAARHGMLIRVTCDCGNQRFFKAGDLALLVGGGRDPRGLRFDCRACARKPPEVTVLQVDTDRLRTITVWRPQRDRGGGRTVWMPERLT